MTNNETAVDIFDILQTIEQIPIPATQGLQKANLYQLGIQIEEYLKAE